MPRKPVRSFILAQPPQFRQGDITPLDRDILSVSAWTLEAHKILQYLEGQSEIVTLRHIAGGCSFQAVQYPRGRCEISRTEISRCGVVHLRPCNIQGGCEMSHTGISRCGLIISGRGISKGSSEIFHPLDISPTWDIQTCRDIQAKDEISQRSRYPTLGSRYPCSA